MKLIDQKLLDETSLRARSSARLRMNHNFHPDPADPLNRLLNAVEPGTFFPVHRHRDKDEGIIVLRGRVATFIYDGQGRIIRKAVVDPREGVYGFDIEAGTWHGTLVLESGTVLYEVKPGPYAPLSPEDIAPWSPDPQDPQAVRTFLEELLLKST